MEYKPMKKSHVKFDVNDHYTGISKDDFFTEGHMAIKLNLELEQKMPASIANQKIEKISIQEMFVPESVDEYKYVCIYQVPDDKKAMDIVKMQNIQTEENLFVNRKYLDNVLTYYPGAQPVGTDKNHPVLFYNDEILVGLIMPFVIDNNAAERNGIEL